MGKWIGEAREVRRELIGAVLIGVFFGLIGPFGTFFNDTLGARIAFWVGMMVAGLMIYGPLMRLALALGERLRQPEWFVLPVAVLVIAAPVAALSALVVTTLWPQVGPHMRPIDWYGQAVILGLPLTLLRQWMQRMLAKDQDAAATASAPLAANDAVGLLDRLPPRLGRDLVCLQMEDHYVRAHTELGSDLVLMPLKAALAGLDVEGLQVHRSWWVARSAVVAAVQDGRNLKLKLSNGIEAPVSRTSIPALRQAGWLQAAEALSRTAAAPSNQKVNGGA